MMSLVGVHRMVNVTVADAVTVGSAIRLAVHFIWYVAFAVPV